MKLQPPPKLLMDIEKLLAKQRQGGKGVPQRELTPVGVKVGDQVDDIISQRIGVVDGY